VWDHTTWIVELPRLHRATSIEQPTTVNDYFQSTCSSWAWNSHAAEGVDRECSRLCSFPTSATSALRRPSTPQNPWPACAFFKRCRPNTIRANYVNGSKDWIILDLIAELFDIDFWPQRPAGTLQISSPERVILVASCPGLSGTP